MRDFHLLASCAPGNSTKTDPLSLGFPCKTWFSHRQGSEPHHLERYNEPRRIRLSVISGPRLKRGASISVFPVLGNREWFAKSSSRKFLQADESVWQPMLRATTLVYVIVPRKRVNRFATCLPMRNLILKRGREQVWRSVCVFGKFKHLGE